MADRPILFSAPMVRAILAGTKTQTRRVLKPQPFIDGVGNFCATGKSGKVWNWGQHIDGTPCTRNFAAKHLFRVGDRLWVREAWRLPDCVDDHTPSGFVARLVEGGMPGPNGLVRFEADGRDAWCDAYPDLPLGRLRPGMHLPRMLTRLTLTVTEVRVQQLQGISRGDAMEEGCPFPNMAKGPDPRNWYADLWNSINGKWSWEANPWVAAYTFTVEARNIDAGRAHG